MPERVKVKALQTFPFVFSGTCWNWGSWAKVFTVCMRAWMQSCFSHAWLFVTLWTDTTKLLCLWDSLGKNAGVGAMPSSRESSQPRDQICISRSSYIAGRVFTTKPPGKPFHNLGISYWKDPDAGKDWRQEEKGTTEDEMAGWHHRLNRHEFE